MRSIKLDDRSTLTYLQLTAHFQTAWVSWNATEPSKECLSPREGEEGQINDVKAFVWHSLGNLSSLNLWCILVLWHYVGIHLYATFSSVVELVKATLMVRGQHMCIQHSWRPLFVQGFKRTSRIDPNLVDHLYVFQYFWTFDLFCIICVTHDLTCRCIPLNTKISIGQSGLQLSRPQWGGGNS